jgi:hypothetical protein
MGVICVNRQKKNIPTGSRFYKRPVLEKLFVFCQNLIKKLGVTICLSVRKRLGANPATCEFITTMPML